MANNQKERERKGGGDFVKFFLGERELELHAIPKAGWRWKILEKVEEKEKANNEESNSSP